MPRIADRLGSLLIPKRRKTNRYQPPGTLCQETGEPSPPSQVRLVQYDEDALERPDLSDIKELPGILRDDRVSWVRVTGVEDVAFLESVGSLFDIHPLVLEDIMHTGQRPKYDDLGGSGFLTLRQLTLDTQSHRLRSRQISMLLLKPSCLITFEETDSDVFQPVIERIETGRGRVRTMSTEYLLYALLDVLVDGYFEVLEAMGSRADALEEALAEPERETLHAIYRLRRQAILARKAIWPLRDVAAQLLRDDGGLIGDGTAVYLRDLHDHTIQAIDAAETMRDVTAGLLDLYLSSISNRMNEVMKALTIIATIFIPITFIAGVYGMNFEYMPELAWPWAYPAALGLMAAVAVGMIVCFRRKKW
ncbi:MAG: magnesium/cobalt transporter CorA [Planctomycetes bacterium]|nr:magnesium/cobalt transporter CorA [Planctomycetota bacterium]